LNDGNWIPDPDILDERYVACHLEGRGIVIFSACSHAGIVNVCKDAMEKLNCTTIAGIVGGLHLGGASVEERVDETITALKVMQPGLILAGHCTGWRAKAKLAAVFNTNYQPLCTGGFYHFKSLPSTN
jgi:7,8-dihydropterin-6-yl-methyl-4-(beta-D-ribofuranosyl)aminobenzene 5'-phosphate synthase